jgi:hypothetical protein
MKIPHVEYHQVHAHEYAKFSAFYGSQWINHLLGDLNSYKALRKYFSYAKIRESVEELSI